MHFSSGINRPPYETADGYLQTTEGCSHNTCLFCTYFKRIKGQIILIRPFAYPVGHTLNPSHIHLRKGIIIQTDACSVSTKTPG